jgi:hypothetical protein
LRNTPRFELAASDFDLRFPVFVNHSRFAVAAVDLSESSRVSRTRSSSIEFWLICTIRNRASPPRST